MVERPARRRNPRGQGERLRQEIIEAAAALLAETGNAGSVSLRGVAKRVGIAATSVYLHFPDVDRLVRAVADDSFSRLRGALLAAQREPADDPLHALIAVCRAYAHFGLAHPNHYRIMFQTDMGAVRLGDPTELPAGWQAFEVLVASVQRCVDAGHARPGIDAFKLASLVWVTGHGMVSLRISRPSFPWPPLDEAVGEVVRMLVGP